VTETVGDGAHVSERNLMDLLLDRYTQLRPGVLSDRWVRAEHVRLTLGPHSRRIADFLALDKHPGSPYGSSLAIHGHEIKVSRSDWLAELRDPSKAEAFARYCHHWWLVVADKSIVHAGELPDTWGLLVLSNGKLRAARTAPRRAVEPLPLDLSVSIAAAAAKTAHREPLHRDAPRAQTDWAHDSLCAWCGTVAPCTTHQPRAIARAQGEVANV